MLQAAKLEGPSKPMDMEPRDLDFTLLESGLMLVQYFFATLEAA